MLMPYQQAFKEKNTKMYLLKILFSTSLIKDPTKRQPLMSRNVGAVIVGLEQS
jgi:hypothetical protein